MALPILDALFSLPMDSNPLTGTGVNPTGQGGLNLNDPLATYALAESEKWLGAATTPGGPLYNQNVVTLNNQYLNATAGASPTGGTLNYYTTGTGIVPGNTVSTSTNPYAMVQNALAPAVGAALAFSLMQNSPNQSGTSSATGTGTTFTTNNEPVIDFGAARVRGSSGGMRGSGGRPRGSGQGVRGSGGGPRGSGQGVRGSGGGPRGSGQGIRGSGDGPRGSG